MSCEWHKIIHNHRSRKLLMTVSQKWYWFASKLLLIMKIKQKAYIQKTPNLLLQALNVDLKPVTWMKPVNVKCKILKMLVLTKGRETISQKYDTKWWLNLTTSILFIFFPCVQKQCWCIDAFILAANYSCDNLSCFKLT